jgi:hypothetical protein
MYLLLLLPLLIMGVHSLRRHYAHPRCHVFVNGRKSLFLYFKSDNNKDTTPSSLSSLSTSWYFIVVPIIIISIAYSFFSHVKNGQHKGKHRDALVNAAAAARSR